jgi:hypothetical protein
VCEPELGRGRMIIAEQPLAVGREISADVIQETWQLAVDAMKIAPIGANGVEVSSVSKGQIGLCHASFIWKQRTANEVKFRWRPLQQVEDTLHLMHARDVQRGGRRASSSAPRWTDRTAGRAYANQAEKDQGHEPPQSDVEDARAYGHRLLPITRHCRYQTYAARQGRLTVTRRSMGRQAKRNGF